MLPGNELTPTREESFMSHQDWNKKWQIEDIDAEKNYEKTLHHRQVLQEVLDALGNMESTEAKEKRLMAANWLGLRAKDIVKDVRMLDDALYHLNKRTNDESFQVRRSVWGASRSLWNAGWEHYRDEKNGKSHQLGIILRRVTKVLQIDKQHREFKIAAAQWLEKVSQDVITDSRMMGDAIEILIARAKLDPDPDVRRAAVDATKTLWDKGWSATGANEKNNRNPVSHAAVKDAKEAVLKKGESRNGDEVVHQKTRRQVFRHCLSSLQVKECWEVRDAAAQWLRENADHIVSTRYNRIMTDALTVLMDRAKRDEMPEVRNSAVEASREIWMAAWEKKSVAEAECKPTPTQTNVLQLVLKGLEKETRDEDCAIRLAGVEWLGEISDALAKFEDNYLYTRVADILAAIRADNTEQEDMRTGAILAQDALWDALRRYRACRLEPIIARASSNGRQGGSQENRDSASEQAGESAQVDEEKSISQAGRMADENSITSAIWELANPHYMGSRDALSFLVENWIGWIRTGEKPQLVEFTAEAIRYNRYSVLALIEHYGKTKKWNSDVANSNDTIASDGLSWTANEVDKIRDYLQHCIRTWEACDRGRIELLDGADLEKAEIFLNSAVDKSKEAKEIMSALSEMVAASHALRVDRRIAKQLADMSNPAFFEDMENASERTIRAYEYERICRELRMHAVPVVLKQLSDETEDSEVRKDIVRLLGYSGSREAIDAVSNQVAAKEKDRNSRQDLLSKYYLEPSKTRNDHTSEILERSVQESKRNLLILQSLNIFQFVIGIGVLLGGTVFGILSDAGSTQMLGGLAAIGGTAGVIRLLLKDPLDRIQSALAKLVQLETAFTTFIWELNLSGTYIQSCYVEDGELENEEIKETVSLVQKSAELTMHQVYKYAEIRNYPRIDRLVPAEKKQGEEVEVTIFGKNIAANTRQKNQANLIYINNKPVIADRAKWEENQVAFTLQATEVPPEAEVSLFVNGMETNSLPLFISDDQKNRPQV